MKIEINENGKWQNSLTLKMFVLAAVGLFLLVPLELIKEMIRERQQNSEEIREEIATQWSGKQTVSGPVLNIPVVIQPAAVNSEPYKTVYHIMPEQLVINAGINTEKRHRGIYESVVFSSQISITGNFIIPEISPAEKHEIIWQDAYFSIGISDNRGLKGIISMQTGKKTIEAAPGLPDKDLFKSGISFPAAIAPDTGEIPFDISLQLSGSESIYFTPLGKETRVTMNSQWSSPGFSGNFLPAERTVSNAGFSANWIITNLNRNFPQIWNGNAYDPEKDSFGTEFILQADHYQKSLRSAKYGILFIALTFLALLFTEMTLRERIHVFHYLLPALGLVLFFSLLNSLSEHTGFGIAYVVSAVSMVMLIGSFLRALIRNPRPVILTSGLLVFLYGFIYILLTLKDYAYLAGNIGLFVLLAITMKLSLRFRDLS